MTRETKVGLLIGLGVILLVGIILTDHLAVQNTDEIAPLMGSVSDQTDTSQLPEVGGERIVEFPGPPQEQVGPPPRPAVTDQMNNDPVPVEAPSPPHVPIPVKGIEEAPLLPTHNRPPPPQHKPPPLPPVPPTRVTHDVKRGETLYEIAQRHFGDGSLYTHIVKANPGKTMPGDYVREGVRLVIPNLQTMAHRPEPEPTPGVASVVAVGPGRIEVAKGDTFINLAQKHLGSARFWPKLLAANKSVVREAHLLRPGMRLRLPDIRPEPTAVGRSGQAVGAGRTYRVQTGDTLWSIAAAQLGDPHRYQEIFKKNREQLKSAGNLPVGVTLVLP